jgi:hypothetical protein
MIIVLFLIGFLALAMAIGLVCAEKAPVAYEDETGFHFGHPNFRESKVFGILVIPVPPKPSDQPADEKVIPLFPLRMGWAYRGVGIAAVLIGLLVLLPEKFQNLENPSEPVGNMQTEEFILREQGASAVKTPNDSSRFIQHVCLRFSQAE